MNEFELSLDFIYKILRRNFLLFLKVFGIGIFFSFLIYLLQENKFQGEFQIVMRKENKGRDISSVLPSLEGINLGSNLDVSLSNSLGTQVGIIKSPSVLLPVYNFVKEYKSESNKNILNLTFKDWSKNYLKVALEGNTTILKVKYIDNDKKHINEVLNKISKAYEFFSTKDAKEKLNTNKYYLNQQKIIYNNSFLRSLGELQKISYENDLNPGLSQKDISLNGINQNNINQSNSFNTKNEWESLENIRYQESNKIRLAKEALKELNKLNYDDDSLLAFAYNFPNLVNNSILLKIELINEKLIKSKSIFQINDKSVTDLQREKDLLNKLLKENLLDGLKTSISLSSAKIKTTERPSGIMEKYNALKRLTENNLSTLNDIERMIISNNLAIDKFKAPWELITKPTIIEKGVYPKKLNFAFFGLIFTSFLASIIVLIQAKKEDLIFYPDTIEKQLSIEIFNFKDQIISKDIISLFFKNKFNSSTKLPIKLLKLGTIEKNKLQTFIKYLDNRDIEFLEVDNLISSQNNQINLIVTSMGEVKNSDIVDLKSKILLFNLKIQGCLIL
ncbi:hypothetical protein [Prochlorococcus sp. MIT 0604]|uniref:hypothetical protein n=1 Tax=Prochlorococcus sp. MIT 0604 TaxID=1501268 RepID=UPI0004F7E077|nr:hypothetical protein [Prochlorococcus sp. MIT 0604]AIQ95497.1 hypothetical protein EW14_1486 [Prochlorococcus sp. MIT 0604]